VTEVNQLNAKYFPKTAKSIYLTVFTQNFKKNIRSALPATPQGYGSSDRKN
jgi:hypothetical protein